MALQERPEVWDELVPVWDAFHALSRSRPVGCGPGAILISEILAWAGAFPPDDLPGFIQLIQTLDEAWLEHQRSKDGQKGQHPDHRQ